MAVLSWDNYVDDSTIVNNSGGSESLSIQKLKTRQIGDVFRQTVSLTSPNEEVIVDFDLGSAKATDLICILNHNMGGYSYTLSFGTTTGASDVGTESGTFWTGTSYDASNEMLYLAAAHTAQHVRLAVKIPAATSVSIGRVWLDSAFEYNNAMDFQLGTKDRSTKTKSRGGSTYADLRQILRVLNIRAYGRNNDDFFGNSGDFDSFLTMDLAVGQSGEIVVLPMTENQHQRQRVGVYGTISNNNAITVRDKGANGFLTEKRFTVEEDRG